jgi:streptomycin 6-kinase
MLLEPRFVTTIRSIFGARGATWLAQLPELCDEIAQEWHLTLSSPFKDLSINYVAPALREGGRQAVLKLGVPNFELTSEIEALKIYEGRGAVRLLEADSDRGALLLERLLPGNMLCTVEDEERSIRIAANVLKVLWRPEPENHHFKSIFNWVEGLNKIPTLFPQGIPIPTKLIDQAKALFADLIPTQTSKMLLHGDFHHYNILSSGERWMAIDPKGIIGEPEFDLAPFLENEIDPKDPVAMRKITEKRITIFCEMLGFDPKRVKDWLIAHSILSTWWLVEDHGADYEKIETSLASIEVFQNLRF